MPNDLTAAKERVVEADYPCSTCKHFMRLRPGFAGICALKQRGREWNEGMAVVSQGDTCDDHAELPAFARWHGRTLDALKEQSDG